ncbi:fatty-acid amide hydrolase 2-A-like [Battus philenor]|uniref:fatty-acid amide hydrolase 2-A-like n=1 Tax=Battus philenor TaxID=42288 RepID=UPI0035CF21C9
MEVGVWLVGVMLRLLDLVLTPLYWLRPRDPRRLPPLDNPLLLRSAKDLAKSIRTGELTSEQVVEAFIERVKEVNPYLNAVVDERYGEALEEARVLDQRLQEARSTGKMDELLQNKPLYGLPFTVKASCSLAGLSNAVGCLERAGSRAACDGHAVRAVRAAGAVPLLVTNTPELCLGWESTNLLHGTTNNPYRLDCTPGGSSGGEGALLASGASIFSVSSDIAGSIRVPAAFCGLFGHKPTPGIIPIEGHIPTLTDEQYPKFLTVGPMCRHADDLVLLTGVMAGDKAHLLKLDEPVDISKIRVHYMTEASNSLAFIPVERDIKDAIVDAARYLQRDCGATISEKKFKALEDSVEMSISVFFSMKDMPNLLQDPANPKRDKSLVVELIKSILGCASRSLQGLGFALITRTRLFIPAARRTHYQLQAHALKEEITSTLGSDGVLLYPAHCGVAHRHGRVFARAGGVAYSMPLNVLGLPAVVVPLANTRAPRDTSLPVALQVIAGPYQDRLCLAVAKQLEVGFGGWRPPP